MHAAQAFVALSPEMQQDHTLALANLATSTQADRTSAALLMKTISELSSQVDTLTAKLVTAQSENAWLKKLVHCSTPAEHGHWESSHLTPLGLKSNQDRNIYSKNGQNSTLTGTNPPTATRWRNLTCLQLVASQRMATTNRQRDWKSGGGRHGTRSVSTAGLQSEYGRD